MEKRKLKNVTMNEKTAFVMGGGRFGAKALRFLRSRGYRVLVADVNSCCRARAEAEVHATVLDVVDSLADGQAAFIQGDAVQLLLALLEFKVPDLVVTAIPGNAVAKLVAETLKKRGYRLKPYRKAVPQVLDNIPKSLVSFVDDASAVVVISYMPPQMRCRENCMPPKQVCASTGRPKLAPMDRLLRFSVYGLTDVSAVLTSRQLTGGVGAIDGKELFELLQRLEDIRESFTLALGTACDCHGIINLFKLQDNSRMHRG